MSPTIARVPPTTATLTTFFSRVDIPPHFADRRRIEAARVGEECPRMAATGSDYVTFDSGGWEHHTGAKAMRRYLDTVGHEYEAG
jgi:hypothetical protein